jgi:hypothetical protein
VDFFEFSTSDRRHRSGFAPSNSLNAAGTDTGQRRVPYANSPNATSPDSATIKASWWGVKCPET